MMQRWSRFWLQAGRLGERKRAVRRASLATSAEHLQSRVETLEPRRLLTISPDEQLFVYLLNKARHDPQAYEDEVNLSVSLAGVEARPPLAVNDSLFASAEFHAQEMADNNYFAHQSAVTGDWPNLMARDAGYDLPASFPDDNNYIESLAAGNLYGNPLDVIGLLIVDAGVPSLGHRKHLLGIDSFNAKAKEIGVGHGFNINSLYDHYWAAHITYSSTTDTFLTGVVFDDGDSNQLFGLNEGLAGVTVTLVGENLQTVTNAAGGWSIQVPGPGTYTVTVSGGSFVGTATATLDVTTDNREVDFISGRTDAIVDFAISTDNLPPVNTVPVGPLNIQEDTSLAITGVSVADPDVGILPVSVTLSVEHGTLKVPTNVSGGITSGQVVGNNTSQIVLTAPLAKINKTLAAVQGLVYKGNLNFNGSDTLTMVTDDQQTTAVGGALSDTDTVDLVISAVNDAPVNTVPAGPLVVVTENSLKVTGLSFADPDLDTNPAVVTLSAGHGTLTLRTDVSQGLMAGDIANNGTSSVTITASRSLILATWLANNGVVYVSDNGYVGADLLTVLTSDQGQSGAGGTLTDQDTVAIQVQAAPTPPVVTLPGGITGPAKGKPVIVGGGATVTDANSANFNGGKLTIRITAGATSNDRFVLTRVGVQSGQVNLSGTNVKVGKLVVGTISGGLNGAPFVINFTAGATVAHVQAVLQRVTLKGLRGKLSPGVRTIEVVATDPGLLGSTPATRQVTIPV